MRVGGRGKGLGGCFPNPRRGISQFHARTSVRRLRCIVGKWGTMGLLTAFYVASDADALSYKDYPIRGEEAPIGKFEASEFPGITSLEIGTLWAILANEEWDVDRHILELVWDKEDGEEMILRFPAELVQLLA